MRERKRVFMCVRGRKMEGEEEIEGEGDESDCLEV